MSDLGLTDIYVDGLSYAEDLGNGNFRFVLYRESRCGRIDVLSYVMAARSAALGMAACSAIMGFSLMTMRDVH